MGTKWEQEPRSGARMKQSGNKAGTRTPKSGKNGNKVGTKWEQEPQSGGKNEKKLSLHTRRGLGGDNPEDINSFAVLGVSRRKT